MKSQCKMGDKSLSKMVDIYQLYELIILKFEYSTVLYKITFTFSDTLI